MPEKKSLMRDMTHIFRYLIVVIVDGIYIAGIARGKKNKNCQMCRLNYKRRELKLLLNRVLNNP